MPSDNYPAASKYLDVLDSKIHYVELGSGDPVVFFHGNPTSSFLWRNILPYAAKHGRAIAFDLIGMGRSGKPDIAYTFDDHLRYVRAFLDAMDLGRFSVVVHDWGGPIGLTYALGNLERVNTITLMETFITSLDWKAIPHAYRALFRLFRFPPTGYLLNQALNVFVKLLLPRMVAPDFALSPAARTAYEAPYQTIRSRRPVAAWPRQLPFSQRDPTWAPLRRIRDALPHCGKPTLLLYADPGALITRANRSRMMALLPSKTEAVNVGRGLHFIQETQSQAIGEALDAFLARHGQRG